jgi:transcriptional regulator with XRE-family HTH domain
MGGRPRVPEVKREAAIALRRLGQGWTYERIAQALSVSSGWVSSFLAAREDAAAAIAETDAATPAPAVESAPTVDAGPALPGSVDGDIAALEGDLRAQRVAAAATKDPAARNVALAKIADTTTKLMRARLAARKASTPERDAGMLRAGHAAADKLRALLEEAIGESLEAAG